MKIVLTGAAGKLGRPTCHQLHAAGHEIRATDRCRYPDLPVRVEVCDLLRPEALYALLEGADAVVHLANHPGFKSGDDAPLFGENVAMNMNVFQAAAETGVKRIVFASSVQVMAGGPPPYLPFDGETPANPGNAYALSKQVSETMLAYFTRQHQVQGVAIRFPWLVDDELLERLRTRPTWAVRNPQEGFSYLHFADAAALIVATLAASLPGFRVYFPAAPELASRQPLPAVISQHYAGIPLRRPATELPALVDTSRITAETGWSARHSRL